MISSGFAISVLNKYVRSLFSKSKATLDKFTVDDPEFVSVSVCPSQAIPRKLLLLVDSHHHQIWHGDCLRHDNASHVNYIDLELH